jgi:hypothetical protein
MHPREDDRNDEIDESPVPNPEDKAPEAKDGSASVDDPGAD